MSEFERRLAAVWFADIVGYTRLSGENEDQAFALVDLLQRRARSLISERDGRLVKCIGDAVLAEFRSTEAAAQTALALRDDFARESRELGLEAQLRIGMHIGDVRATPDGDVYGDGVNTASRLQALAEPGQLVVSQDVWRQLRPRAEYLLVSLGERRLEGIAGTVWAFTVEHRGEASPHPTPPATDPLPHTHLSRQLLAVSRAAVLYAAAGLILLQLIGMLRSALDLGRWVTPASLVLLAVGFLIVLVTAWTESRPAWSRSLAARPRQWDPGVGDLGDSLSRRRLPELTWPRALWGGVAVFALLIGVAVVQSRLSVGTRSLLRPQAAHATSVPAVAVLPFETDGADDGMWSEGLLDLVALSLGATGQLRVVDPRAVLHRAPDGAATLSDDDLVALGSQLGARYLIRGWMSRADRHLTLEVEVYDVVRGQRLGVATVDGSPDQIASLVDILAARALRLGLGPDAPLQQLPQLSRLATSSIPALQAYLQGEQLYRQSRWVQAREALQEAVRLSPTFALALYRLALTEAWSDLPHQPRPNAASFAAERHIAQLPQRDSMRIAGLAQLNRDDPTALRTFAELVRQYPDDVDGWFLLGDARYHLGGRSDAPLASAALEQALRLDPGYGPAYLHLIDAAVAARDTTQLRRWVTAYRRVDPGSPVLSGFDWAQRLSQVAGSAPAGGGSAAAPARPDPGPARSRPRSAQPAPAASPAEAALLDSLARVAQAAGARPDLDPTAVREANAWMEASRQARAAGQWRQAVAHARRATEVLASARAAPPPSPAPARADPTPDPAPPAPPEQPGHSDVTAVLAVLERAIEAKDIPRMQQVWTNLTGREIDLFRQSLPGMRNLNVTFDVLEVAPAGGEATARVRTTYAFEDDRGRQQNQSFVQSFRIARAGGRWVIVDSSTR